MSAEPQLFRINHKSQESEKISEVDFSNLGLQERWDIQEWVADNPSILGEDLLIITKEFSDFDRTRERLDLLAVDMDGKLVIIELKRDDSGSDVHWQAIKYASYLRQANQDEIIHMLAAHEKVSEEEAEQRLRGHIDSDNLDILNNDQRIILASHRFAPEATSAVLWLNEKAQNENLITCIQLTPYPDSENSDSLYLQANTIIPVPGAEKYIIRVGTSQGEGTATVQPPNSNVSDNVTKFLRKAANLAIEGLPDEIRPDKKSKWAGGPPHFRYYNLWYSRPPWSRSNKRLVNYQIALQPLDGGLFKAGARSEIFKSTIMKSLNYTEDDVNTLESIAFNPEWIEIADESLLDQNLEERMSKALRSLIEKLTPEVERFEDERANQEAAP